MSWVYRRPFDYRPKLGSSIFALLYAAGQISGTAALAFSNAGAVTGAGALAGTADLTIGASGTTNNANPNELIGVATIDIGATGTVRGSGALVGVAANTFSNSATPTGTSSYRLMLWPTKPRRWDYPQFDYYGLESSRWTIFPYTVSTATAGIGSIAFQNNGLLRGTGALAGTAGTFRFSTSGTVVAAGSLAGTAALTFDDGASALTDISGGGTVNITGDAGWAFTPTGNLTGVGNLYGPAAMRFDNDATLTAIPGGSGVAAMTFGGTGRLVDIAAPPVVIQRIRFATSKASIRFQVS